jgi:hypothetical protein
LFCHFPGLGKQITTLAGQKDCDVVGLWKRSIINHLHWTACTAQGDPDMALAIWKSGVNHIRDVHQHDDPIYPQCQHAPLPPDRETQWLQPGMWVAL